MSGFIQRQRQHFTHISFLVVILTASVLFRVVAAIYLGDQVIELPGTSDQISYHALAQRFIQGYGFTFGEAWWPATRANSPTAHWSFLYTFYLAGVYTVFGVHPVVARILQAIIVGILQPLLAYQLGKRLKNHSAGIAAAAITAIYGYFIYYAATLMTEPFYITTIMLGLWLILLLTDPKVDRLRTALLLGIALGIAVLLRQLILLIIPFLFLWLIWVNRKDRLLSLIMNLAVSLITILLMALPFTVYNYIRFQRFVFLNTNSGFAFFWGNHPIYGDNFIPILTNEKDNRYIDLIPPELLTLDEASLDQALMARGFQFIIDDPIRYLKLSFSRIESFFMFWPSTQSSLISNLVRVGSFGLFLPFMLWGVGSHLLRKKPKSALLVETPAFLFILFAVLYSLIHIMTWTLVRYRLPVDAVLIVFAGSAVNDLLSWIQKHRTA